MLAMLALVILSMITHALIERPGIQAGQWVWAKVGHSPSKRGLPSTRSMVSLPAQRT
jgi:hypothetical protein